MNSLFRPEAVHATEQRAQPLDFSTTIFGKLTLTIFSMVALLIAFLVMAEYTVHETVPGYLTPSRPPAEVYPPFSAIVGERFVEAGSKVEQGAPLYQLERPRTNTSGRNVGKEMQDILQQRHALIADEKNQTIEQANDRISALETRMAILDQQISSARNELDRRQQILDIYDSQLDKIEQLASTGVVSALDLDRTRTQALESAAARDSLGRLLLTLQAQRLELVEERSAERANVLAIRREYEQKLNDLSEASLITSLDSGEVVTAPIEGTVTGPLYSAGEHVEPGFPIVRIIPENEGFEARLLVPSRAIGTIQAGQTITLHYEAFPRQQYGVYKGRVTAVSNSAISQDEARFPITVSEPVFVVTASLDSQTVQVGDKEFALLDGVLLTADVETKSLSFLEFAFEPILKSNGKRQ